MLVKLKVSLIFDAGGPQPARAAKAATTTFPIVFAYGGDPNYHPPGIMAAFQGPGSSMTLFWLAGLVAVMVYIVDVKPAIVGVQGGGQRY